MTAPAQAMPCDEIPVQLTVANTGTAPARDVRLAYPLPEGWVTTDGKTTAQFFIDRLPAGESRDFAVNIEARRTGDFKSMATATATPGLKVESAWMPTAVRQAVLALAAEGPETVYAGRPAVLNFFLTNTGTAPATTATVEVPVPAGMKFISATENGGFDGNTVTWKLPTIPVEAKRTFSITMQAEAIGAFDAVATAKAYCATPARDTVSMSVLGIPAMLLEVTDLIDPVEVGSAGEYEIAITNQGSAAATNVRVVATLEDSEQFVSASGGKARAAGKVITFEPIPSIAPKATVTLRLAVNCVKEGDARFKVSMTADQLGRPVEETEATHIYR
jgi:uncharacterized repeat protein (TIGR01451 family)